MSFLENSVWDRRNDRSASTMSRQLYMLLVCTWTAIGIAFSAVMSFVSYDWPIDQWGGWGLIGFFLAILVVAIAGTMIAQHSDNPFVSALGYSLVAGPFGLMLGPYVAMYTTGSVVKIFGLTAVVVLILGIVGAVIPDDLSSWGVPLTGALLLLIGAYFFVPLLGLFGFPVEAGLTVVDIIGLVIFAALIIYDLNRAVRLPHTLDNAIDSAVAIYLDFINVFIRLLSLLGNKK